MKSSSSVRRSIAFQVTSSKARQHFTFSLLSFLLFLFFFFFFFHDARPCPAEYGQRKRKPGLELLNPGRIETLSQIVESFCLILRRDSRLTLRVFRPFVSFPVDCRDFQVLRIRRLEPVLTTSTVGTWTKSKSANRCDRSSPKAATTTSTSSWCPCSPRCGKC